MKVTTWTVRKALNAISDDNKTSIHCYEFYASPVISKPRYFELFFHFPWDFEIVGFNCSYSRSVLSHHILGAEGLREGCVKTSWRFLFPAYFYSWRWILKSYYTASTSKWFYFSCYESLSKGTMFKWVYVVTRGGHAMVSDNVLEVYRPPLPGKIDAFARIASPVKIAFRRVLF